MLNSFKKKNSSGPCRIPARVFTAIITEADEEIVSSRLGESANMRLIKSILLIKLILGVKLMRCIISFNSHLRPPSHVWPPFRTLIRLSALSSVFLRDPPVLWDRSRSGSDDMGTVQRGSIEKQLISLVPFEVVWPEVVLPQGRTLSEVATKLTS